MDRPIILPLAQGKNLHDKFMRRELKIKHIAYKGIYRPEYSLRLLRSAGEIFETTPTFLKPCLIKAYDL